MIITSIHSVEKAVNIFVQRMEKKVDRVLREFIFRSGGTVHLEIPNSQPRLSQEVDPAFSQPFSPNEENEDLLNTSTLLDDNPDFSWLFPYIFIIGELAILGMEESEEGNLSKLKVHCNFQSFHSIYSNKPFNSFITSINNKFSTYIEFFTRSEYSYLYSSSCFHFFW